MLSWVCLSDLIWLERNVEPNNSLGYMMFNLSVACNECGTFKASSRTPTPRSSDFYLVKVIFALRMFL